MPQCFTEMRVLNPVCACDSRDRRAIALASAQCCGSNMPIITVRRESFMPVQDTGRKIAQPQCSADRLDLMQFRCAGRGERKLNLPYLRVRMKWSSM